MGEAITNVKAIERTFLQKEIIVFGGFCGDVKKQTGLGCYKWNSRIVGELVVLCQLLNN